MRFSNEKVSAEALLILMQTLPVMVCIEDRFGRAAYCNSKWHQYTGWEIGEERLVSDLIHPDDVDNIIATSDNFECRLLSANGDFQWYSVQIQRVTEHVSDSVASMWVCTRIEESRRKSIELAGRVEARELELEHISLGLSAIKDYSICLLSADGFIRSWNEGASDLTGYLPSEIIGKHFSAMYTAEAIAQGLPEHNLAQAAKEGKLEIEALRVKKDGQTYFADIVITPVYKDGILTGFSKVTRDITERKRAEQELLDQKTFFEAILREMRDGVIVADHEGKVVYTNVAALRANPKLAGPIPADSWSETLGLYQSDMKTPYELTDLPLSRALAGKTTSEVEIFLKPGDADGRWVEANGAPLQVNAQQCGVVVFHDITNRKNYEQRLEAVTAKLDASNKELQNFASIAAHDLQEPLRTMGGYLDLFKSMYEDRLDVKGNSYISVAIEITDRMIALIRDLLVYSKIDSEMSDSSFATDASKAVGEAMQDLHQCIIDSNAVVEVGDLPAVSINPTQLVMVFKNLIGNAIKFAGPEHPRIQVSAATSNGQIVISVSDNGIGIDMSQNHRIFELMKRLHVQDEYPGSGIGLALCRKIIERHGGRIWVESVIGKGATFHFSVPATHPDG